jgi:hypothetical protein
MERKETGGERDREMDLDLLFRLELSVSPETQYITAPR